MHIEFKKVTDLRLELYISCSRMDIHLMGDLKSSLRRSGLSSTGFSFKIQR